MATETNSAKSNSKTDNDASTNEVKQATLFEGSSSTNENSTSAPTKEEPKAAAVKESAKPAAKEENKAGAKDSAKTNQVKQETKPGTTAAAPKEEEKPVVKDEAKTTTASSGAKAEPKPVVKDEAKPAAVKEEPKAAAQKEEAKPAPAAAAQKAAAAKEEAKPAPAAAVKEEPKAAAQKEEAKPAPAAAAPKAAPEPPRPAAPKPPPTVDTVSRVGRAEAIVRRNVLWSLGAGVVPFPIFDAVAITGVQLKMLAELSELYKVAFTESIAKKVIGSLLSGIGGVAIGTMVGSSLVKLVPGVGTALGIMSVPVIGGAATHATGKIFVMHFEAGGTLLDFDPHKMRSHFKQEFEKSRQAVADMHKAEQAKTNKSS